ncbi:hypothetical protein CRYUN_Cryun02cG0153900 [Craigia yunnanensis]
MARAGYNSSYACIFLITLFMFMTNHRSDAAEALLIRVHPSGKGDYRKIQDVIDAVPSNNKEMVFILVKPGIYKEKIVVPEDKPFITISGSRANGTIIAWNDSGNIFEAPTFFVLASDFVARYLDIQNTYGASAKAVALRVSGDRRCHLHSLSEGDEAITAQCKESPSEDTGLTLLSYKITGVRTTLLGRAWGPYSKGWDDWGDSSKQR